MPVGRTDPTKAAQLTRNFGLSTLVVLVVGILSQIMGWAATKYFLLHIAPGAVGGAGVTLLGTATFYILIASLIATLGDLRLGSAYTFFVARGGKVEALTGTYLLWRVVALGGLGIGLLIANNFVNLGFGSTETALALFVLFPILEIPSVLYSTLQTARGRTIYGQFPLVVEMTVRMVLLLYVATLFNTTNVATPAGGVAFVTDIAWAYVIGAAAGAVASAPLFRHVTFRGLAPELRDMFTFATPLMGAMFITYAVTSLPPFIFKYLSNNAQLQYFSSANAFLILLMFLPNSVIVPLFPDIASLHVQDRFGEIRQRTRRALRYTVMILAPSIIAIVVFRVDLLEILYANNFLTAQWGVAILALTAIPLSLGRVMGTVLDGIGQQKRELYLSTIQIVVLAVALVLLVPPYKVTGGAAAVALSSLAGFLFNAIYLHRFVQVHPSPRPFVFIFLAAVVTFAMFSTTVLGYFRIYPAFQHWYVLIPIVLAGQVVYVVILALVGELTKEDVRDLVGSAGLPSSWGGALSKICWRESWPDPDRPAAVPPTA